jgi:uncharacterized membrane protein
MASPLVLGTGFAGFTCLILALIVYRKDVAAAQGLDKLVALACVFYAAPLAAFGAEHLTDAADIVQLIPTWIPARVFWAYFVGVALIAAALSLSVKKYVRRTASCLALMFFLFVLLMHIPGAAHNPHDRFGWAVALRDLSFGCGALALAGSMMPRSIPGRGNASITVARIFIAITMIVYAIEHFLHPGFVVGLPLQKTTPAWMPLPHAWAYITAAILLTTGIAILINSFTHDAALWAGLWIMLVTLCFYLPILIVARGTGPLIVGLNYVYDTMLFGGTLLLLAKATSATRSATVVEPGAIPSRVA